MCLISLLVVRFILNGIQEVVGSIPSSSTKKNQNSAMLDNPHGGIFFAAILGIDVPLPM